MRTRSERWTRLAESADNVGPTRFDYRTVKDVQDLVIIGAGGLGREVKWLVERINQRAETWNLIGFIDDGIPQGTEVSGIPVIGGVDYLLEVKESLSVVCAIGAPTVRKMIVNRLRGNSNLSFPALIDPSVKMSESVVLRMGCVILMDCILTVDIEVGEFTIINWDSSIGHDSSVDSFVTIYPSCNISGNVRIGELCEIGTGTQVIQVISIGESTVVGAGSVVVRHLPAYCTAVGVPAKPIKFHR